jgi:hypothetical protein
MNPKETPFTEAYVKDQQKNLSLGYKLFMAMGAVLVLLGAILAFVRPQSMHELIPLGMIILLWSALAKQRLNTFRENLELSKMIQQLHEDKDVAERQ